MAMLIYLLVATICRAYHEKKGNAITAKWLVPVTKFRVRELAYLVLTLILVPTVVASLKAYTHVVCPVHLTIFDGTLPYLPMLDSMRNTIPDKCFLRRMPVADLRCLPLRLRQVCAAVVVRSSSW